MSAVAERLAALAEEELGLVVAGRWDELAGLHARRDEALADLPPEIAPDDRPLLERALQIQVEVQGLIERAHGDLAAELGRVHRGREAARGYAAATGRPLALNHR